MRVFTTAYRKALSELDSLVTDPSVSISTLAATEGRTERSIGIRCRSPFSIRLSPKLRWRDGCRGASVSSTQWTCRPPGPNSGPRSDFRKASPGPLAALPIIIEHAGALHTHEVD